MNKYRITNYECFEKKKKTYYKVRRLNVTIYQWLIVGSHSRERSNTNKSMSNVRKSVWPDSKKKECTTQKAKMSHGVGRV